MAAFGITAKLLPSVLRPLCRSQVPRLINSSFISRQFSQTPDGGDSSDEVRIPTPKQRHGESLDVKKARLLYQSRKRGMLENGILLSTFADRFLDTMVEPEISEYDDLINLPSNDWDIYYWAIGQKDVPPEYDTPVFRKFKDHAENKEMEMRRFPTL